MDFATHAGIGTSQSASRSTRCLPGLFHLDSIDDDFNFLQFRDVENGQNGSSSLIARHEVVIRPRLGIVKQGRNEIREYTKGLQIRV